MTLRGFDAWLTREPDYGPVDPPTYRCETCGGFLRAKADRTEYWEDTADCSGRPGYCRAQYTESDAGILDIIGWEHLHERFTITTPALCGLETIHAPHKEVLAAGDLIYRICNKCGTTNREVML